MSDRESPGPGSARHWDQFGPDYDFPAPDVPIRSYVIATSGRVGSHYLANILFQLGDMGAPLEYLHPRHRERWKTCLHASDLAGMLDRLKARRTSPSGWFGLKAHWHQFESLADDPKGLPALDAEVFIRLSRRNKIAQAISYEIARQTNAWISLHEPQADPVYDGEAIAQALRHVQAEDDAWEGFFAKHRIAPIRFDYEDLVAAPDRVVGRIRQHLGLPGSPGISEIETIVQRQATGRNAEWEARFRRDQAL